MPLIKVINQYTQTYPTVTAAFTTPAIPVDGAATLLLTAAVPAVTGITATVALQISNDPVGSPPTTWGTLGAANNINSPFSFGFERIQPTFNWARLIFTVAAGSMTVIFTSTVKGPN